MLALMTLLCFFSSITNCISTFASKNSALSVIFHDSKFYFKNLLAFLKFMKIGEFYEILKLIKFAFSVNAYPLRKSPSRILSPNEGYGSQFNRQQHTV